MFTETGVWLRLPSRDAQQAPPAAVCPRCGSEQYSLDTMAGVGGGFWCAACAAERETEEESRQT